MSTPNDDNQSIEDHEELHNQTRRNTLKLSALTGSALVGVGGLGLNELRKWLTGPDYAEEDDVGDIARDAGDEAAGDRIDDELQKMVYTGLTPDHFEDVYETVRDDLSAEDYNHSAANDLHEGIRPERQVERLLDDNERNGELVSWDFRYGAESIDSKLRLEVSWDNDQQEATNVNSYDLPDSSANAIYDAALEIIEDLEEYEGDDW